MVEGEAYSVSYQGVRITGSSPGPARTQSTMEQKAVFADGTRPVTKLLDLRKDWNVEAVERRRLQGRHPADTNHIDADGIWRDVTTTGVTEGRVEGPIAGQASSNCQDREPQEPVEPGRPTYRSTYSQRGDPPLAQAAAVREAENTTSNRGQATWREPQGLTFKDEDRTPEGEHKR